MKITDKKATEFYKCFINLNQIAKNLSSIATKDYTINNLKKVLRKRIKPKHTKYYYVIEIDRPYY